MASRSAKSGVFCCWGRRNGLHRAQGQMQKQTNTKAKTNNKHNEFWFTMKFKWPDQNSERGAMATAWDFTLRFIVKARKYCQKTLKWKGTGWLGTSWGTFASRSRCNGSARDMKKRCRQWDKAQWKTCRCLHCCVCPSVRPSVRPPVRSTVSDSNAVLFLFAPALQVSLWRTDSCGACPLVWIYKYIFFWFT